MKLETTYDTATLTLKNGVKLRFDSCSPCMSARMTDTNGNVVNLNRAGWTEEALGA